MSRDAAPRIGVLRPTRVSHVIAEAEARVIRFELERRLGPVTLDLRIDGDELACWQPITHAGWPAGIDAELDAPALWGDPARRLCTLLVRTIEPAAAVVRTDMLRHLGIIPTDPFALDDEMLLRLDPRRVRPTDLWLAARAASEVRVDDPDIRAMVGDDDHAPLDAAFDRVADRLLGESAAADAVGRRAARLAAERDELRRRLAELDEQATETAERVAQLERELEAWQRRAERAELRNELAADGT